MAQTGKTPRKRSGIRYDRILILIAALALVIMLLVFLIKGIIGAFTSPNEDKGSLPAASIPPVETSATDNIPPEYKTVQYQYSDIQRGELILVNNAAEYIFPSADADENVVVLENKTQSYTVGDSVTKMNRTALKAFNEMMDAFSAEKGISSIRFITGYRTKEAQDARAESYGEPKGGFSEHNTGLCVDIAPLDTSGEGQYYTPTGDYAWINDNCDKYGFILRYPADKESYTSNKGEEHHFRYVGIPHAYYMKKNNLCLEEYLTMLSTDYKYGTAKLEITCYNKEYEVYYFSAAFDGETSVYVPSNRAYTVSGDNFGGFIVTAEK